MIRSAKLACGGAVALMLLGGMIDLSSYGGNEHR